MNKPKITGEKLVENRLKELKKETEKGTKQTQTNLCMKIFKSGEYIAVIRRLGVLKTQDDGVTLWNPEFKINKQSVHQVYEESRKAKKRPVKKSTQKRHYTKSTSNKKDDYASVLTNVITHMSERIGNIEQKIDILMNVREDIEKIKIALFDIQNTKKG